MAEAADPEACYDNFTEAEEPDTRMRLIMENIVANKGRFKPSRKPVITYTTPGY